ncbi:MAG: pilus assembly PilX N-terminal domain-containing protein [Candidatus Adiutrix sp.]|jgi:hypothetical protein|nr:pilus assembly PilX N-terminal domain-containing protein [Candidatus Adiutrix sp.]
MSDAIKAGSPGFSSRRPKISPYCPEGSILMFSLVILLMIGLMGAIIHLNTTTELRISHDTYEGRDAFTKADSTARVGLLLGRALLYSEAGDPGDYVRGDVSGADRPFKVELDTANFTLANVAKFTDIVTAEDIKNRYLQATHADSAETPQVKVLYGDEVIGTASVDIGYGSPNQPGASLGQHTYNRDDGNTVTAFVVVTADGRVSRPAPGGSPGDNANYFRGDYEATHSIVTTIFRETMS